MRTPIRLRLAPLVAWLLLGLGVIMLALGAALVWLGAQPSADPHGGALVTIPGLALTAVGVLLTLAGLLARRDR